jgi:DNA-binding GntR family transcriptional regulator
MVDAMSEVLRALIAKVDPRPNRDIMVERQRVLDLMRRRDAKAAAEAMAAHLRRISEYLVSERDKKAAL